MRSNTYRKRQPALPINKKQITVIKLACNLLRIDDQTYRAMLRDRYQVTSCTKLTYDQAGEFIRELEGKGFVLKPKAGGGTPPLHRPKSPRPPIARTGGNVIALASSDEVEKIYALAGLIEWRVENGFRLWMEKRMGVKEGRIRTAQDAYVVIEGLKKMFENQMKAKHGPAWWRMKFTQQGIRDYIAEHCPKEWR